MKIIKENEFASTIEKGTVLVDFYADWCGPCKMLAPVLEDVSKEISDAEIVKVNVDESPNLAAQFSVQSIPTLILFKDGQVVDKTMGFLAKPQVIELIQKAK